MYLMVFTILKWEKELEMARQASMTRMNDPAGMESALRHRRRSLGHFFPWAKHQEPSETLRVRCLEQNTRCDLCL